MYIVILADKSQPIIGPFAQFEDAFNWAIKFIPGAEFTVRSVMSDFEAEENLRENSKLPT
jgi:hypothetical protein